MNPETAIIIGLVIGLIVTIILYVTVMSKRKDGLLSPFAQFLHNYFHFKQLYVEVVLKFVFALLTIACITGGFFLLFVEKRYDELRWIGIALMILGPIALRFVYEMFMMFILLVQNVIDINKKLKGGAQEAPTMNTEYAPPVQPAKPMYMYCGSCGAKFDAAKTDICPACGIRQILY